MTIADRLSTIAENQVEVYNAGYEKGKLEAGNTEEIYNQGKQDEQRAFWEKYQNRWSNSYFWAFGNNAFDDNTYNPIKPIICGENHSESSQSMFRENRLITDTKVEIQASSRNMNYCFFGAVKLKTIRKLTVFETTIFNSTFSNCTALENITFGGVIGKSIDFKDSTLLTKASIKNIFETLSANVTGQTLTLNKTAVQNAFGTDYDSSTEWTTLKNSKSNWTITLS